MFFEIVINLNHIIMKKISILFISLLALTFSSCSDDNDSSLATTIDGKWNFNKMSVTVNNVTSPELDYEGNEPGCMKDYIEFVEGGILKEGDYSGSNCVLNTSSGTWSKSGNTITITSDGITIPVEVVNLTSSILIVKYSETEDGLTLIVNMSFTKA